MATPKSGTWLYRYSDLERLGIMKSRTTLKLLIEKKGFPAGFWLSPGTRVWDRADVDAWLAARAAEKPAETTGDILTEVAMMERVDRCLHALQPLIVAWKEATDGETRVAALRRLNGMFAADSTSMN